ncbi:MAG: C40 family peptidase [Chloroflexi bacterium]|nr:C40 family peptidase [Chloroflexota bacterium]
MIAGKVLLALGVDGVGQWVLRAVVTFIAVALVVVLIVIQTVALALSGGGHSGPDVQAANTPVSETSSVRLVPTPGPVAASNAGWGSQIIQLAQSWLGVPYQFGGCSRGGVDCSCLVLNVYAALGIHLPRVAVDQFNATQPISDPQPGDLVFFANTCEPGISHVGIYIGNGLQINAPTTGQVVSVAPVFTGYWGAHYAGARRVPT